jgi:anthranilate/para-aminobenzoate synthase component II
MKDRESAALKIITKSGVTDRTEAVTLALSPGPQRPMTVELLTHAIRHALDACRSSGT